MHAFTRGTAVAALAALSLACGSEAAQPFNSHCPRGDGAWCDVRNRDCQERLWRYRACLAEEADLGQAPPVEFYAAQALWPERVHAIDLALAPLRRPLQAMGFWPRAHVRANEAQSVSTDGETVVVVGDVLRDAPAVALGVVQMFDVVAQVRAHGAQAVFGELDTLDATLTRDAASLGRAALHGSMQQAAWQGRSVWGVSAARWRFPSFTPFMDMEGMATAVDSFAFMQHQLRLEAQERFGFAWAQEQSEGVQSLMPAPATSREFFWPSAPEPLGLDAPAASIEGYTLLREDRLGHWATLSLLGIWTGGRNFQDIELGPDRWLHFERQDGSEALLWALRAHDRRGLWRLVLALGGELPEGAQVVFVGGPPPGALPLGFDYTLRSRCLVLRWAEDPDDLAALDAAAEAWARADSDCL